MSSKLYFIQNGKVVIYHEATKSSFIELKPDDYFGEISFFTEKPRCASAKCSDYVDLLALSKQSMNLLLDKFPKAKEVTENIAKKCVEGDLSCLNVYCYICKELGHVAIRCRKILLNFDQEESRTQWLGCRTEPQTKYINPTESHSPSYYRVPKHRQQIKFTSRNIKGIPQETDRMFPQYPGLSPKVRRFIEQNMRVTTPSSNSNSVTPCNGFQYPLNNSASQSPALLSVRKDPLYTIIYMNSEGSDHDSKDKTSHISDRSYRISFSEKAYSEIDLHQTRSTNTPEQKIQNLSKNKCYKLNQVLPLRSNSPSNLEVPSKEETSKRASKVRPESSAQQKDVKNCIADDLNAEVSNLFDI